MVSIDPDAIATFESVQSGAWRPPGGENLKLVFKVLAQIPKLVLKVLAQILNPEILKVFAHSRSIQPILLGGHGQDPPSSRLKNHQARVIALTVTIYQPQTS